MFGIGFGELFIIIVVLIIAVGPQQLPSLMRTIGKTIRSMRQASQDLRDSIGLDEFMNQDLLSTRPRPYRRVKPELNLPPKDADPIEEETAPESQKTAPETSADDPTNSAKKTDRAPESTAKNASEEAEEKLAEKTREN